MFDIYHDSLGSLDVYNLLIFLLIVSSKYHPIICFVSWFIVMVWMLLFLPYFWFVLRAMKLCFNLLLMAITMLIIHPQYPHCHAPIYHLPFITTPHSMHGRHPHPSSPSLIFLLHTRRQRGPCPSPAAINGSSQGTAAAAPLSMVPPALGASL